MVNGRGHRVSTRMAAVKPRYFRGPAAFRKWLAANHRTADELLVGFYKKDSGKPGITWPESVDQALCFGWIDGVRRRVDEVSYTIRFTPRRAQSIWSTVNIRRVAYLAEQALMAPAGTAAFERRSDDKSSVYAYEQRQSTALSAEHEKRFKANRKAWAFFQAQAPSYQRVMIHHVVSARKEETRERRFERLFADSAQERRSQ